MGGKKVLVNEVTRFNDIYVIQDGDIRELWFKGAADYFLQSRIDVRRHRSLKMIYAQPMIASLLIKPDPKRALIIGLGGAILPNFLAELYPEMEIDNVEVDPKVVEIAKKYFFFRETKRCRVFKRDGRVFIQERQGKIVYDLVFLDAFKSGSVPFHLKTRQFYEEILGLLNPAGGVVGSNLYGKSNALKPHDLKTFANVFKHNYIFEDPDQVATALHAANGETRLSPDDFMAAADALSASKPFPVSMKDVAAMYKPNAFAEKVGFVFKDDFAEGRFLESVEENNLSGEKPRAYAIKNTFEG
ncbi:MAG: spermidine synthase [Nitrospinales bacterium]